ncbi:hypothetical protein LSAT2_022570, partial [Lamellibrachia satsuma]
MGEHYATKQAVVVGLRDERHRGSRGGETWRWQGRRGTQVAGKERHGGGRGGETWRWQGRRGTWIAGEERHGGGRMQSRKGELARTKPNH